MDSTPVSSTCEPEPSAAARKKERRAAAWARRRADPPTAERRTALDEAMARHGIELVTSLVPAPARLCTYESWPVEPPTRALNEALGAAGVKAQVVGFPLVFHVAFGLDQPAQRYRDLARSNKAGYSAFALAMLRRGVRALERGAWFVSSEHGEDVIDRTIEVAYAAAKEVAPTLQ